MFDISPNDIALLTDENLRTLVGLLCEAELKQRGFSTSAATWGGHQDARDGGIDVRISLPASTTIEGFIPKSATGFQVKTENMPPAKILREMRPSNRIRPMIEELAKQGGAYIIVSSKGSTTAIALQNRYAAMRKAINDIANAGALKLDFYDRTRLATWVRNHPGLILWTKRNIGKGVSGWQSYGAWAYEPEGEKGEYLIDERLRVRSSKDDTGRGLSSVAGINSIRRLLSQPGNVVRLIGLSGVGKTRFVQALFDERIGEQNLTSSLAVYTNMVDDPNPQPFALASDMMASSTRAILIVDNCAPELHRRIAELCRDLGSTLSAITVEYDIREDEPEGTETFRLDASSPELIEKLVIRRFPTISGIDARTVATFSDGNARVAMALAGTIARKETIAGLSDEELFRRLFQQRHQPDESVLRVAQACSLVYSFDGENLSEEGELARLGALVGKTPEEMHACLAELMRRELVQRRGVWRAVLPHAIANRLAATALQNIPFSAIEERFVCSGYDRLLRSFSRRLGYLDGSKEAKVIVSGWLTPGGLLENVAILNELGAAMFTNIAPVYPEKTLSALERALLGDADQTAPERCRRYAETLRSLAYAPPLFEKSTHLLVKMAESGEVMERHDQNEPLTILASLFYIHYSGTHAPIEERLRIVEGLLLDENPKRRSIGVKALKAALKTSHFESWHSFDFGARSRDYGYWPRNWQEVAHWFASVLKLAAKAASPDSPSTAEVRAAVAEEFSGLWYRAKIHDEIEHFSKLVSANQFWPEGWIAVRRMLQTASASDPKNSRLVSLGELLSPVNLSQRVRAIVLSSNRHSFDYFDDATDDDLMARLQHTEEIACDLGKAVSLDESIFCELLPDLVRRGTRLFSFGRGLAASTPDPRRTWSRLVAQVEQTDDAQPDIQVFSGFLCGLSGRDPETANALLENTLQSRMAAFYPKLQIAVPIDKNAVDRLLRSLQLNNIPVEVYRNLAWGNALGFISNDDLVRLIFEIASKPDGLIVALEILHMRLYSLRDQKKIPEKQLSEAGCELMSHLEFHKMGNHDDYSLGEVAKACLAGKEGSAVTRDLCSRLKEAIQKYKTHPFNHSHLVKALFLVHPSATLDGFLADPSGRQVGVRIIDQAGEPKGNPLDNVPESDILAWCEKEPTVRYELLADLITVSTLGTQTDPPRWTTVALQMLENAPDRISVLKGFINQLMFVSGWIDSLAASIERNTSILSELPNFSDQSVVEFIREQQARIRDLVEAERRRDENMDRMRDERFE